MNETFILIINMLEDPDDEEMISLAQIYDTEDELNNEVLGLEKEKEDNEEGSELIIGYETYKATLIKEKDFEDELLPNTI